MTAVVIGAGEVGTAIWAVIGGVLRDLEGPEFPTDTIHICFPWSPRFEEQVRDYQGSYTPDLTVIHSTVPVGTSRRLGAVHSPVTGKHPHLERSVRTFVKPFGGERAREAAAMFDAVGVRTECYPDPETTEAGKLLATLQYGWLVAIQKEGHAFAERHGLDPDIVYRRFNQLYNDGYAALGEPYRLPILDNVPGSIGGHCVIPNATITESPLATTLLDWNARW